MRIKNGFYSECIHKKEAAKGKAHLRRALDFDTCLSRMNSLNKRKINQEERLVSLCDLHKFFDGWYFYRNFPVMANYFGHFVSPKGKTIIEINEKHHRNPEVAKKDARRLDKMKKAGWDVLVLWHDEPDDVWVEKILHFVEKVRIKKFSVDRKRKERTELGLMEHTEWVNKHLDAKKELRRLQKMGKIPSLCGS